MWRRRALRTATAIIVVPILFVVVLAIFTPLPAELGEPAVPSLRVLARDGKLLREVRTDDGVRARPLPLAAFPPHVQNAVLAAEDRRFRSHVGVDVVALVRAVGANLWHRRIVSGASTITMQLARTLRPHKRSLWGKIQETALAFRLEAALSKDRILEEYLNRVTYGPNVRGYAAASQAYFGIAPESLSLAEAALIAGLPRGPSLYDVTKRPQLAKKRRDRVLDRMVDADMIDAGARERAAAEPIVLTLDKPAFGAPHLVRDLVAGPAASVQPGLAEALGEAKLAEITTTIDPNLQRAAEAAVRTELVSLRDKHVTAAAAVVVDNATGDVLAWVGSPDFFDAAALGQNDGVLALRQPGSSLKPFIYAEAMSRLGYTGATMLPDVELHIPLPGGGDYVPHDYDTKLRGPTRLREALGSSLNVPAVYTVHQVGTQAALDRLHAFGFQSLAEPAEHYGPALALGDGEVTLLELANAYATLAREGMRRPLRIVSRVGDRELTPGPATPAIEPRIAAMLTDILHDKGARVSSFGDQNVLEADFDLAAKTGTSKGYRDNVAVGYTRAVTVAAWAGNFDGSPMAGVSGITGAGPIFRAVIEAANGSRHEPLAVDAARLGLARTAVCALSGDLPTAACEHRVFEWLPEGAAEHAPACTIHEVVRIDPRNNLRAGPACPDAPARVFEHWDAPYTDWARSTDRPIAPTESSPECPVAKSAAPDGPLRIAYPFDGARFVIDPERDPALQLLEVRLEPDARVAVAIDDVPLPKSHAWQLVPGAHTITAAGATAIHFSVR